MRSVELTVHRATDQIGGNCIEISTGRSRLVLDVGRPLDAHPDARQLLPATLDTTKPVDAVLVSHPHQDHYGLLEDVPLDWPVHCGEPTARLIKLTGALFDKQVAQRFVPWKSGARFEIGEFSVTPILTDHSAFDAHMLLIEADGKRILYSGDFRTHGRKSALTRRLMANPPDELDVLLMEGTNLGSNKPCVTESELEARFVDLFRSTKGRVFVAWSAQNVDRTVTLYRASLRTGRTLVVDLYTAEVLEALAPFGKLPQPGWANLKVVITAALGRMYRRKGREEFVDRMAANGMSAAWLAADSSKWVVMVRPSLIRDYSPKGAVPTADDAWCWSMWRGYLENDDGRRVSQWFEKAGSHRVDIHTSGHASASDLRSFAAAMNAKEFVPIHGVKWDVETDGFSGIRRLRDGEPLVL